MLPRFLRLSRTTFPDSRQGKRVSSPHFSVSITETKDGSGGCAVVISKKVAKLSVARHLLKRRIMHIVRPWCASSHTIIIVARAGSAAMNSKALTEELAPLFSSLPSQNLHPKSL